MGVQEIVGIVDRSGSMNGKEEDTVGGINSMLEEVKSNKTENDDIRVSLKLFDHEEKLLWQSKPIDEIDKFLKDDFVPRGQTALLDALGHSLNYFMEKKLLDHNAYDKCLIYVSTDGLENASRYYTREKIRKMVETAEEKYGINIIYLGANQDAILEAKHLGINYDRAINYSETRDSTEAVYRAVGRAISSQRSEEPVQFTATERQRSQPSNPNTYPSSLGVPPPIKRQRQMQPHFTDTSSI